MATSDRIFANWAFDIAMSLRVLHLSDIHFSTKTGDEKITHDDVREHLLIDLRDEIVPKIGTINKILIAGDIAFSGKRSEYDDAANWLERVAAICGCLPTEVLTVPGNHDVDRGRILPATRMIHRRLRNCSTPEAKQELVALAQQNDGSLTDKLTDYQAFASSYGCGFESPSRPSWSKLVALGNDCLLKFVGLTTVQVCDEEDQPHGLFLGAHQYILERAPRVELIVVMHHPPDWIKDRQDAFQYLDSRARVLVYGHEHCHEIQKITNSNHEDRLVICSGAVTPEHAADPYIYRYNILEFALDGEAENHCLTIKILPRIWVPDRTRFDADTAPLGGKDSTTFNLPCPQFRLTPAPVPNVGENEIMVGQHGAPIHPRESQEFIRLNYFFWRFLTWQERLKVIVQTDILPNSMEAPRAQTMENLALERARIQGNLGVVWSQIMEYVPEPKREPNPFNNHG